MLPKNNFQDVWKTITLTPKVDMKDDMYKFVTVDNTGAGVLATDPTKPILGVLVEPNNVNQPAQVVAQGIMTVKVGSAAVATGAAVTTDANGLAATAASGNTVAGVCLFGGSKYCTILLK